MCVKFPIDLSASLSYNNLRNHQGFSEKCKHTFLDIGEAVWFYERGVKSSILPG